MKKAEWILRSHREHQATLKLLQAKLQRIGEAADAERDDYIEAQMLKRSKKKTVRLNRRFFFMSV